MKATPTKATSANGKRRRVDEDPQAHARRMANYIRMLEFIVAVLVLTVGIIQKVYPYDYMIILAVLLGYPLIAQIIAAYMEKKDQRQQQTSRVLVQLDAILIGVAMAALHFALVPAMALLIIVHANAVTSGGVYIWLMNIFGTVVGAVIGSLILGFNVLPVEETPVVLTLVSLLGLGLFVGASAFQTHSRTRILLEAQSHLAQQQKQAVELSRKLAKYLSPQIWGSLFSGKRDAKVETRRKKLTVFFSDIKGFSAMSEELPLDTLTKMLNTYLSEMTKIASRHGGTVDKFIGDAVMVFFGDPSSKGSKEDATACVAMAIDMQKQMKLLRQRWTREGITHKLEIRIGINTGYCTVGNFGTDTRLDYTILGTDVNLASRLESACKPGHILISETTHELVKDRILCRAMGDIQAKGFNRPISVFEVLEMKSRAGSGAGFLSLEAPGFAIHMDLHKVRNFDKKKILVSLATGASHLKKGEETKVDMDAEGFSLHIDSTTIRDRDRSKILEILGKTAMTVKDRLIV
ncbi:MAG: adenylate cyclase [Gammaproteobacteria bacterium HGW-Gammaproteobacteria-14]|nr:MAG: adenylate cyclase [Gammaproteobacteria bacterium HGW-Gammaproteobacteria-14]